MQAKSIILIVDDTETGREILEALLQSSTYQLAFACNGPEALLKAEELTPDLILLDVMMPGMDGFEVCRRLRSNPRLAEIPIILVTALDDRQSRLQGIEAGADDFVTKPFDHAELRARVRTITRLNRYRRLLDERARFEWVVEQAEDGYVLLSQKNEMLYANGRARWLLGLPPKAVLPTKSDFLEHLEQGFRPEPVDVWRKLLQSNIQPASPIYLIRPETANAQALWLEVTLLNQVEGDSLQRLLHLRDVTSQMSTQRDIWTFHSMVMHKLNTPLHAISGGLQLLTPEMVDNLTKGQIQEVTRLIDSGVHRLNVTISDILQYLRMPVSAHSGDAFVTNNLEELIKQISTGLELKHCTINNGFRSEKCLILTTRAFESILWELLENAKKFHPSHNPTIAIELAPLSPTQALLRVVDNGVTLTPEQIDKVWLPYYQAEKYFTGEVPGMGLGLTMVAALIWEVGGSCRLRNRTDGVGTIVELTIPLD
ncbi:MAG: hybrid sensor histidine kinase/response regulator [Caldilinea sp. CFX5]|nr:hybrid sensor histidine kinase/response regulator [Caldilinea sp. CFX5]